MMSAPSNSSDDLIAIQRCHEVVSSWLESQGYSATLEAFRREAGETISHLGSAVRSTPAPGDAVTSPLPKADLKDLVTSFYLSEATKQLASLALASKTPADHDQDAISKELEGELEGPVPQSVTKTLREVHASNILSVTYHEVPRRSFDTASVTYRNERVPCLVTTAADKTVKFTSIANCDVVDMFTPSTAPILSVSFHPLQPRIMLTGSMDGTAILTDLLSRQVIQAFKDHSKYVVRTAFSPDGRFLATCSYDKSINVYSTNSSFSTTEDHREDAPVEVPKIQYKKDFSKKTSTNPETIVFHPSSSHLIYSCRDDNYLRYVDLNSDTDYKVTSFNLNENQDNHVSFSVVSISIHPSKLFLSCQTDTQIARIILLPFFSSNRLRTLYTSADQSLFSTPRHAWLSSSGIVLTSDDGIVRIIDVKGHAQVAIGTHGPAASLDEDVPEGETAAMARARRALREADRGSSMIKDVCVIPGTRTVVSVGFDKTIRISQPEG